MIRPSLANCSERIKKDGIGGETRLLERTSCKAGAWGQQADTAGVEPALSQNANWLMVHDFCRSAP